MLNRIKLLSTDFDGTLFSEFENPPIPEELQGLIRTLQAQGAKWVINTGRDMSSLMEALGRAGVTIEPDYLILVEREIYAHQDSRYLGLEAWNGACARAHRELFARVKQDLPQLVDWINARFHARLYEDAYSPLCLIAGDNGEADVIHNYLRDYSKSVPHLTVVRNDVYARFCHADYDKGTTLAQVTRLLGLTSTDVLAAGDHLNDLPMLSSRYASRLVAPINAVAEVKAQVRKHGGFVSAESHGRGVAEGIKHYLETSPG